METIITSETICSQCGVNLNQRPMLFICYSSQSPCKYGHRQSGVASSSASAMQEMIDTIKENPNEYISKADTLNLLEKVGKDKEREQMEKLSKPQFCECNNETKTGCTSAMHCNICGKLEQTETWLMHSKRVGGI